MSRFTELGLRNRRAVPWKSVPIESMDGFRETVVGAVGQGWRLTSLFGLPDGADRTRLVAILADDARGALGASSMRVEERYPALTPACPQANRFEREIAEQCGVIPEGHPWLKPLRRHAPDHAPPARFDEQKNRLDQR